MAPTNSVGSVKVHGKTYNLAPIDKPYNVSEIPNHPDVDAKLERRVIYRHFGKGIMPRADEPSVDATMSSASNYSIMRQVKNVTGFYWANGCDTRIQDRIFTRRATTANTIDTQIYTVGDATKYSYAASTSKVYAIDRSSSPYAGWTASVTSVPTIQDIVKYGRYVYLALGGNNGTPGVGNTLYIWDQTSLTTTWAAHPSGIVGHYFVVIRDQLWRAVNPIDGTGSAAIYSTVNQDPAAQVWSGATVIGDASVPITALDVFQDFIMIFKQDGVWSADKSGNVYPIFPGFKNLGLNPRPIGQWQDSYFFASDYGLVWKYSSKGGVTAIGFDFSEPYPMGDDSTAFSIPNAATRGVATTNFLLVGFNSHSSAYTNGGHVLAWDGDSWHPMAYYPNQLMTAVGLTGGQQTPTELALQFFTKTASTYSANYMTNPLIDPFLASSFDTSKQNILYLNSDNGGLEDEFKVLEKISVWLDNPTYGTVSVAYAKDEEIPGLGFIDLGSPAGVNLLSNQTFIPTDPKPHYRKIMLRLSLQSISATKAPQVRYVVMHYKQREPQKKVWDITLLVAQNTFSASGRLDVRNIPKVLSDLDDARAQHRQVEFKDILGQTYQVYVDQVDQELAVLKGTQAPNFVIKIKLVQAAADNPLP